MVTVLCALVVIAWLVIGLTLKPYLVRLLTEWYQPLPGLAYMLTAPPLGVLAAGCLIPAFTFLRADIRVRSVRARHVLLFLALNRH